MLERPYPPDNRLPVPATPASEIPFNVGSQRVDDEVIDLRVWWQVFLRRRWLILGVVGMVLVLGMAHTLTQQPIYQSVAEILVTSNTPLRAEDMSVLADLQALTQKRSVETQVAIITSPALLQAAFEKLDRPSRLAGFGSLAAPEWAVKATPGKNTDIIEIEVLSYVPSTAAAYANSIARTYFERDLADIRAATRQAREYIEEHRGKIGAQLNEANRQLAELKRQTGNINPESKLSQVAQHLAELRAELDDARAQASAGMQSMQVLQRQLAREQKTVVADTSVTSNPRFSAALATIDALQSERTRLLQEYTNDSPEVREINARIAAEEGRLRDISATIVANESHTLNPVRDAFRRDYATALAAQQAARARVNVLQSTISTWENTAKLLPEQERKFSELLQRQALLKSTYEMLINKSYTLLAGERTLPNGRIVSEGIATTAPVRPRVRTNVVLFFLLGLICAVLAAAVAERLDDRVYDQQTAEQLTGLPALGSIHEISANTPCLLSDPEAPAVMLEAVRVLRNTLSLIAAGQGMRSFALTSVSAGEGKSTISTNLGITLAREGKRVLLVDGDWYRQPNRPFLPTQHDYGLTNVLRGGCTLEDAILPTAVDGLFFLPTGTFAREAADMIDTPRGEAFFHELAQRFDRVIVDCPPCAKLSDIQLLSRRVDGLLMVVAHGRTLKRGLVFSVRNLRLIGARLVGIVMNRVPARKGYGYSYYDPYYPAMPAATPAITEQAAQRAIGQQKQRGQHGSDAAE